MLGVVDTIRDGAAEAATVASRKSKFRIILIGRHEGCGARTRCVQSKYNILLSLCFFCAWLWDGPLACGGLPGRLSNRLAGLRAPRRPGACPTNSAKYGRPRK